MKISIEMYFIEFYKFSDRLVLIHLLYSHQFLTSYLIFYRNGVTQIENAGKIGI